MTLEEAEQEFQVGNEYMHYKDEIYKVDFIATNTETNKPMVAYHKVATDKYFVSPADIWLETVAIPARFKLLVED